MTTLRKALAAIDQDDFDKAAEKVRDVLEAAQAHLEKHEPGAFDTIAALEQAAETTQDFPEMSYKE